MIYSARSRVIVGLCGVLALAGTSILTVDAGVAGAKTVKSQFTLDCDGTGSATISPGLPVSGKAVKQTVSFSGTDSSCTYSTSGMETGPTSGTWSGTIKTGPLTCASLLSGFTASGKYTEDWNTGETTVEKFKIVFPPLEGTTDTSSYSGKISGTLGKGTGTGDIDYSFPDSSECTTGSATSAVISNSNGDIGSHNTVNK